MYRRVLNKKIFYICIFVSLTILLTACRKETDKGVAEKVFGLDYTEELDIPLTAQIICEQDGAWAITTVKNDYIYKLTDRSSVEELEAVEWRPEEGNDSLINIAQRGGVLYAQIWDMDRSTIEICKLPIGGGWSDVMSLKAADVKDYTVVGNGFYVDGSGKTYLTCGNRVACFDGKGQQAGTYDLKGEVCFFQENERGYMECIAADTQEIRLYELTENGAEERWRLKVGAREVHEIVSSEPEMLCLATELELLFLNRESGELLARTDLVKMGCSAVRAGYYDVEEGELRLYSLPGNGTESLCYSLFGERDSSAEQRTELVYGMVGGVNADTSSSIWTAITAFNQDNEEYYVTIKNYDNNTDRLHADMAAGNGPDIIDMTYSDYYSSYVKNGYLEDLLPYLERSQYREDMIWNVLDAYKTDGGLYVLIPQFRLSGLLLHPEGRVPVEEWNMETFLGLLEENRWEKDIFGSVRGDPQNLLLYMLSGRKEEFLDWEHKTASFDTVEFTDMLALCREYAQAGQPNTENWTSEEYMRNTLCLRGNFGLGFISYLSYVEIYGREYPIYGYPTLTGQAYGISACADSCAIYAGSRQKEGAWEFIESLLKESNQKYLGIANPGFPIRRSVLEEMAEEQKEIEFRSGNEWVTLTENEISILKEIIYEGNLREISIDRDIWDVIYEETAAYFAGDKSAEETARVIQSRVRLVLEE